MKPPAFQFYADDFVAGTSILSTEEVGAYILLLCHQWNAGAVPDDERLVRRIARITQPFDLGLVLSKFEKTDGGLKNRRLEAERQKQEVYRLRQAENGKRGGRPKGLANPSLSQAKPKPNPTGNPNESSPSPSPINTPLPPEGEGAASKKPKGRKATPDGFEKFWELYPRRDARVKAEKAWAKVSPDDHEAIFLDLKFRPSSPEWVKDGGQFIPQPASYLNGQRWRDERSQPVAQPKKSIAEQMLE